VRLESLRPEERRDLLSTLGELQESKRNGYLSFRLILNHLVSKSILPRLSEWQIPADPRARAEIRQDAGRTHIHLLDLHANEGR
jgi:hypothetical protein